MGKVIWVDNRYGKKGWSIVILPICIVAFPFILFQLTKLVFFDEDYAGVDGFQLIMAGTLICGYIGFIGIIKYLWLLRKAPQRILLTQNALQIHYFFGIEKTLPISEILSTRSIKQGAVASLFSPCGSRQPVLEIHFRDGTILLLNGDYVKDSDIVSLISTSEGK